jgi:HEAT repeat protein
VSVTRDEAAANAFFRDFYRGTTRQRARLLPKAPLDAIQGAALASDNPRARRACLFFLDHYANDQSTSVFAAALHDPVDFVRDSALHSIACESCKVGELCATDVVPALIEVLEHDPSRELRIKSIPFLLRLASQDVRAAIAVERAARHDPDALIRRAASDGLAGRYVAPRKRYERTERRHARRAAGSHELSKR